MSASLMPWVRMQFLTAAGAPLAGGQIFTYAAGTSTPLAAYSDSSGTAALTNPIVLDASGSVSTGIWLGTSSYKVVVQDSNGVTVETIDGVSSVSQAQLQAGQTLSSLTVSGDGSIAGNLTVTGKTTTGTLEVTGATALDGALTAVSGTLTGALAVGGNLSVAGTTTLAALTAGATTVSGLTLGTTSIHDYVTGLIPALSTLTGPLVLSAIVTSGSWVVFTFGSTAGSNVKIGFGAGSVAGGASVSLPSGFSSSNARIGVSLASTNSTSGNNLDGFSCSVSGLAVTASGNDNSAHTYSATCGWFGVCWATGQ